MIGFMLSAGLLSVLTLLANISGFFRELLFARAFGATQEADSFVGAFSIVATCFLILVGGSLQGAFMPRYQQAVVKGENGAARGLWRAALVGVVVFSLVLSVLLYFLSERIVSFVLPGFDASAVAITSKVLRWLSPIVTFYTLGALYQSVLHAHRKFLLPALVPIANNVVLISFLIFLVPAFGLAAISYGTVVGGLLWLCLIPSALSCLPEGRATWDPDNVKGLLGAILPLVLLLAVDQIAGLIQKALVSDLQEGSIAVLSYAARLEGLPVGIFAGALASVIFPALVEAAARNDKDALVDRFGEGFSALAFLLLPSMAFLMTQSDLLVKILLERGSFDSEATFRTARALEFYSIGIFFQGMIVYLNRVYFSFGNTRSPMSIGIISAGVHIIFSWVAVKLVGYLGIALGTSLYAGLYAIGLLYGLRRYIIDPFSLLMRSSWRSLLLSIAVGAIMANVSFDGSVGGFVLSVSLFSAIYIGLSLFFNNRFFALIRNKLSGLSGGPP